MDGLDEPVPASGAQVGAFRARHTKRLACQRFDRRLARGSFSPAKRKVVSASEIAGLLKPPTARCGAANVVRSGGMVPAPPRELLTYERQADLLPVGWVESEDGARPVGVPLKDTFFTLTTGRSRFGKTETAIVKMVGLARAGHGCLFLDPHADALARMKPYLTDLGERIVEVNLTAREGSVPGGLEPVLYGGADH